MLLELFGLYGRFCIVDLPQHPDILIDLLLEFILSSDEVEGSASRRRGCHPLYAVCERLAPRILDACQIDEYLFGLRIVPDAARLALAPNHCYVLPVLVPCAHHAVRSASRHADEYVSPADRGGFLLLENAQVDQLVGVLIRERGRDLALLGLPALSDFTRILQLHATACGLVFRALLDALEQSWSWNVVNALLCC